jgi:hypothetical protein
VKEVAGLLCLVETGAWQEKFGTAWSIEDAAQAEMHECGVDESLDNPRHDGDIAGGPSKEQGAGLSAKYSTRVTLFRTQTARRLVIKLKS